MERSYVNFEKGHKMSNEIKTYMSLLLDTVSKKEDLLNQLILETIKQSNCFQENEMKEEKYDEIYHHKMELIKEVETLDEGFQTLYERIKDEMKVNRYEYEQEIKELQNKIRSVTDKVIRLQKLESDNKLKFQVFLNGQRKKIKDYTVSKRTSATYYKNMMQQFPKDSAFMNKKQ